MALPVVKCILCPLLMLWLSMTPRIMEYSINMTRYVIILYVSKILKDEFRNSFCPYIWIILFRVHLSIHVPSATFSLNHSWASSKWRRFLVMCLASDAYTYAWLSSCMMAGCWIHPIAFIIPRLEITSAFSVWLTALISDSAVEVDTLPWSVEHQQIINSLYCLKDNWAQKGAWDTSNKKVVG